MERGGARLWQVSASAGTEWEYAPYFYNPHLDPDGNRLAFVGHRGGDEQAYLLDRASDTVVQLTEARGQDQHWAPYIKEGVSGIRPQFICWSQPDWQHVVYWEGATLRRVHVESLEDEALFTLPEGRVPQVPHCSHGGWVAWGYLPADLQRRFRGATPLRDLLAGDAEVQAAISSGRCGFMVFDLAARRLVMDVSTPFWPNHVQASPDHRWVLFCQEGPWQAQRMHVLDVARGSWTPLRPQEGDASIGHEFWLDATHVGYHGALRDASASAATSDERGFFGRIDVTSGARMEIPSADPGRFYGHYHASPDGTRIVTDGEATADWISVAEVRPDSALQYAPLVRHDWPRGSDQRVHPHPHWHAGGRWISFTGALSPADATGAEGARRTHVFLASLP